MAALQMRAVTNLESCGQAVAASRENGFGKVGIAAAASRLASGSQGWRPAAVTHLRVAAARHVTFQRQCDLLLVRASEEPNGEGAGDDMSGYGLGGKGSFFGFGRFQELQVGRLAMVGFAAAVIMEVITGKGVLGQLGINPLAVKGPFLAGFLFLLIGGLLGGYVVINNPPDTSKAPPNDGDGLPRNPLKTYDPQNIDPLTTFTRGGVVDRPSGQKGKEPYVSDLDLPPPKK
uniref:LHC-related protein n=1 Tax=Physcomitrium patens TaxID=3218 RepID=A0A7I4EE66_PHYPA